MSDGNVRETYHHGNLSEALVAVAVELIEELGVENLSMREVAKRAGVSSGAPFRHYRSKGALLMAVAEEAMARLTAAVQARIREIHADDPMEDIQKIGEAYLSWAIDNPTHFAIISSRTLIDFQASVPLRTQNEAIKVQMIGLLERAQALGQVDPAADIARLVLASRAMVYGLARMAIDGHFPEWHPRENPQTAARAALRIFIEGITRNGRA